MTHPYCCVKRCRHRLLHGVRYAKTSKPDVSFVEDWTPPLAFTGLSGSGKSSLVFDTIAAESQRQLNETYSSFVRHRLPKLATPDAERLAHLPVSILVDQKRLGGNARSTVGTAIDIQPLLRLIFSRAGKRGFGIRNDER